MADENDARRFRWLFGSILASGLALTLGTATLRGSRAASSVAVGVAVAALNFVALRYIVRALTTAAATGERGGVASVLLSMKLLILLAAVWLLLSHQWVSAGPLVLGYVALPIGVAIGTLLCDKAHAP